MTQNKISPSEALDRMFSIIREEAASNPTFARRMLDAVGVQVVFQGTEAASSVDPVIAAGRMDQVAFREMFSTFSEADVKKLLTSYGLATVDDIKCVSTKPKKIGFIELMWAGARSKLGRA